MGGGVSEDLLLSLLGSREGMRGGASFWYITLSGIALETSMGSSPAIKQIVKREEVMSIQLVPIYIVCGIYSQHTLPKACTICPSGANHLRCRPVWGSQQGHGDQCCPPRQLSPSTWACWDGGWPAIHPPRVRASRSARGQRRAPRCLVPPRPHRNRQFQSSIYIQL